ncbi:hypothetical protein JKY79_02265, partial [Candidatus Babeliales bacterium]|nr:hypothetical protein [Candidatus Babeliales bacterium]
VFNIVEMIWSIDKKWCREGTVVLFSISKVQKDGIFDKDNINAVCLSTHKDDASGKTVNDQKLEILITLFYSCMQEREDELLSE